MERLVYIASVGYSGSTLLDMLLGSNEQVTSLGEVYLLSRYARENANCTCGQPVDECEFWHTVEGELRSIVGNHALRLSEYPLTIEEQIQSLHRRLPSLSDLLLVLGNRTLWRALSGRSQVARRYAEASQNALRLFEVVSAMNRTPIIVDSSKYALPMKSLYLAAPDRTRIVFLVRDGRATSLSLAKRHRVSFEEAARTWKRYNWNLQLAMRSIPKEHVELVRYEDLCRDPTATLARIAAFVGAQSPLHPQPLEKDKYHNIGGNPMRFRRDEVEIRLDEKWKQEMDSEQLALFDRVAGRMNRQLGYI